MLAGAEPGEQFVAGYVTEYSLSVDNLFVFVLLLSRFAVPDDDQHKILLIGIAISLALRGACIAAGTAAISAFEWVFYLFGALLIYTAVKLAAQREDSEPDFHDSRTVRLMRRVVPTTEEYDGSRLVTSIDGRADVHSDDHRGAGDRRGQRGVRAGLDPGDLRADHRRLHRLHRQRVRADGPAAALLPGRRPARPAASTSRTASP